MTVKIGFFKESDRLDKRVSLTPDTVQKLTKAGYQVYMEHNAGIRSFFTDKEYIDAGVSIENWGDILKKVDIVLSIGFQSGGILNNLESNQLLVGLLQTGSNEQLVDALKKTKASAIDLAYLPRTLSRAQTMDALSSQANIAGYKAAILAAEVYSKYFPMMTTASGSVKPAKVLVLGTGVAGLQALATAKKLGAQAFGYDIRQSSKTEVESVGASFIAPSITVDSSETGYARELTEQEKDLQKKELEEMITNYNVIITTAAVPGKTPPKLITHNALNKLEPGTVVIDMGSSGFGGNVDDSIAGQRIIRKNGVVVLGAENLAATMPTGASMAYANNIVATIQHISTSEQITIDFEDQISNAICVCYNGEMRSNAK